MADLQLTNTRGFLMVQQRLRFPNSAPLFVEQVAPQTEQLPAIGHGKFLQCPSRVSLVSRVSRPHPLLRPLWSSHPVVTWPGGEIGLTKNLTSLTSSVRFTASEGLFWSIHFKMERDMQGDAWLADYCIQYTSNRSSIEKFKLEQLLLA